MSIFSDKTNSTHSGLSHEVGFEPFLDTLQVQVDAHQPKFPTPFD